MSEPDELRRLREKIDDLDSVLVRTLNERAELALTVGRWKRERGIGVFDGGREKAILAKVSGLSDGPLEPSAIRRVFERILDESRRIERTVAEPRGEGGPEGGGA